MPLYEYNCDKCNKRFEAIIGFSEKDKIKCPKCNKLAQRLLSGFAIGSTKSSSSKSNLGENCNWSGG